MLRACVAVLACLSVARAVFSTDGLRTFHIHPPHKDLASVLAAIDEKLKALETITAVQAKQSRRLDVIQDKLDRVETSISIKLERAQLAVDRLELRLHVLQTNVQTTIKESTDRLERSQTKVAEVAQNLTSHLDTHRHLLEKVSGSYAETWRRGLTMEGMLRDGFPLINLTRRELADGFRGLARRQRDSKMSSGDLEAAFTRRLNDNTYKLDLKISKMQEVLDAQKSFMSSCKSQAQQDDPRQFTDVLDKLFEILIKQSESTFRELKTIQTTMRSHDSKVLKLLSTGLNSQNEASCRHLESVFLNSSHTIFKEQELRQLTDKFVALTNQADAALQRLQKHLGDEDPAPASNVTAEADQLLFKLKRIKAEQEEDYDDDLEDEEDENFDEDKDKNTPYSLKAKQADSYFSEEETRKVTGKTKKSHGSGYYDDGGGDIMDEDKDILTGFEPKATLTTRAPRAPHRRHLHKHPYDRGPG